MSTSSVLIRLFLPALLILPRLLLAECVYVNWDDYRYVDDGPGTRGSLDGTMSVDCLTLIGIRQGTYRKIAYLRDDRDVIHTLVEGGSVGMKGGVVIGVYDDHLLIEEYKQVDGEWFPFTRTLSLSEESYIRKDQ